MNALLKDTLLQSGNLDENQTIGDDRARVLRAEAPQGVAGLTRMTEGQLATARALDEGTTAVQLAEPASRIVSLPRSSEPRPRARVLQAWEGVVLRVDEDAVYVRLMDRTQEGPDEEAEMPLKEISPDDLDLVREGAVFYWTIAYQDAPMGQRTKVSMVRFRRLPVWRADDVCEARREALELRKELGWH